MPSSYTSNTAGALNGSAGPNAVDEGFATLNAVDAQFYSTGSISLGDGGIIRARFSPDVIPGASLYLFVGEVGLSAGESLAASIEVSDTVTPSVPLPASALLLLAGLGALGVARRRRG